MLGKIIQNVGVLVFNGLVGNLEEKCSLKDVFGVLKIGLKVWLQK